MKRFLSVLFIITILFSTPVFAEKEGSKKEKEELAPNAETAVVIDLTSDYILFDKNMNKKMYPASTTKLMTAILTVENVSMEDMVVVTESAIKDINKYETSNVDLNAGDTLSVDELLHALLIPSGNDAANVLAEFVGGSIKDFVVMMNERAKEIGCENTNFVNPNGLHHKNHYSTAYDLALIAKEAIKKPEIADIVQKWSYVSSTNEYTYASTNHLVSRWVHLDYHYVNATGIKTGYTDQAKRVLASSASDGEHTIIAVVMGCEDGDDGTIYSFVDAKQLLSHFLETNRNKTYISANQIIGERTVKNASGDGRLLLTTPVTQEAYLPKEAKDSDFTYEIHLEADELEAPIRKNQKLGHARVLYKGEFISKIDLLSDREIKKSYIKAFFNMLAESKTFNIIGIIVLVLLIIMLIIRQHNISKRKKRRAEKIRQLKRMEEEEKDRFRNSNL